jgi:hypothetical protein
MFLVGWTDDPVVFRAWGLLGEPRSGACNNQKIGVMGDHRNSPLSTSFNSFNISFCLGSFSFRRTVSIACFNYRYPYVAVSTIGGIDAVEPAGTCYWVPQTPLLIAAPKSSIHRRVGIRSTNSSPDRQCQEMPKRWPSSRARSSGMQYIIEAGPTSAPFSTGILGAGMSWTPETFSCRRMFANRLLANRYPGSGQTMKRSLPSHATGSIRGLGSAIT